MYRRDLDKLIRANNLPNFILLRGNDEFLNELYAKEIFKIWNAENSQKIYYDEYKFDDLSDFLEASLFANSNALHIKMNKTIPIKEVKHFINCCEKDKNNHFLFEFYEDGNKISNDFIKAFGQNFVRFFKPSTPNEAILLLTKKCMASGVNINQNALFEIYRIHNANLNLCAAEIDKFAMSGLELNQENVAKTVFGLSEVSFDDLFDKIINLADFRDDFFTYIQSGSYNEISLINYMYSAIFRLYKVHSHIKIYGRFDLLKAIGYTPPPNVANALKNQALRFNTQMFKEIFVLLNETEFDIKTKKNLDKTTYMLSRLLEFQAILSKTKSKF